MGLPLASLVRLSLSSFLEKFHCRQESGEEDVVLQRAAGILAAGVHGNHEASGGRVSFGGQRFGPECDSGGGIEAAVQDHLAVLGNVGFMAAHAKPSLLPDQRVEVLVSHLSREASSVVGFYAHLSTHLGFGQRMSSSPLERGQFPRGAGVAFCQSVDEKTRKAGDHLRDTRRLRFA